MKIIDLLIDSAQAVPNQIAVISENNKISYSQMLSDVYSLYEHLRSVEASEGTKVAIVLGNSYEYMVSFFAVSAVGAIIMPLSANLTTYEITEYIKRADASIIITNTNIGGRLSGILNDSRKVTFIYVKFNGKEMEVEFGTLGNGIPDDNNSDVALFALTSGTASQPKIVMLTNDNLISNMLAYREQMDFTEHQVAYCSLSFNHIYCISAQILTHISRGDTFVITKMPFFVKDFIRDVRAYNVSITAFVPYMAILLTEYPALHNVKLESLKYVTLSGAKTPTPAYNLLTEKFGTTRFINTYGMSEAGSRISIAAPDPKQYPPDSVGRPLPGVEVRVIDEKGTIAVPGTSGEICIKSSGVMKGYYKQPHLTTQTILNGWLKTGDIGKIDEDGNLFILGRIKDLIISGGENICPLEIEECLAQHPAISEVAVVGQYHRLLQEVPCAYIVKKNQDEKLNPIEIAEFCKNKLSNQKIPKSVRFLKKLPKLDTLKIDRKELKKMTGQQY